MSSQWTWKELAPRPCWRSVLRAACFVVLLGTARFASAATVKTPNMQAEKVIQGHRKSTDFAWTPDLAWLVIVGKDGPVTVYNAESFQKVGMAADFSNLVCTETERGIQSVVIHPTDFVANKQYYVYIFYVRKGSAGCAEPDEQHFPHPEGPTDRVSRFTLTIDTKNQANPAVLDMDSEMIIFDTGPVGIKHNGGGLAFGVDGNLYVTTGDAGYRRGREAIAVTWTDNLHGKVLRFTPSGGVPPDNPYVDDPNSIRCSHLKRVPTNGEKKCQEVYSRGLRNPFNLAMDPNSEQTRYFINDVGDAEWEEINEGGIEYITKSYGWNGREGPCQTAKNQRKFCAKVDDETIVDPIHWYPHPSGGAAITGGAFVPLHGADTEWSTQYGGEFLYCDFDIGRIYHLSASKSKQYCRGVDCEKQISRYDAIPIVTGLKYPLRMHFGPYKGAARPQQVLYFLLYSGGGQLWRVSAPDPESSNRRPTAVIETFYSTSADGSVLTVRFDGSKSTDPDVGDELTFTWDFGENGAPTSNDAITSYSYTTSGTFTATLTVDDGNGGTSQESVVIHVDVNAITKTALDFPWSSSGCPDTYDFCGVLDFCHDGSEVFGYKLPCESVCKPLLAPVVRLWPGKKYQLTLRNVAKDDERRTRTNIHTHGLHISGSGNADDVTRLVKAGHCLKYTWNIPADHPGGTHWYHPHPHGHSEAQVAGGAFGFLIVEENTQDVPEWSHNELLLQISRIDEIVRANKKPYEVFSISAKQWYRFRVSIVDPDGEPLSLRFTGCDVHKVASDGIWHSSIPGPLKNKFEMTGASRGDFAIRCPNEDSTVNILYGGGLAAIVNVGAPEPNPYAMTDWMPDLPASLQNISSVDIVDANRFSLKIQREALNNVEWNADVPLDKIAFNEVHEWELDDTSEHPFHLHLYHMMVVTPGGCGSHAEGEFYDTIAGPPCTVRFRTADIGQRCVFHCHVMLHSDLGAVGWVDVEGNSMPTNNIVSPEYACPSVPLDQCRQADVPPSSGPSEPILPARSPNTTSNGAPSGSTSAPVASSSQATRAPIGPTLTPVSPTSRPSDLPSDAASNEPSGAPADPTQSPISTVGPVPILQSNATISVETPEQSGGMSFRPDFRLVLSVAIALWGLLGGW